MHQNNTHKFLIVDDDSVNNMICTYFIRNLFSNAEINAFTDPAKALSHISSDYTATEKKETILLLDLNMPELSGWDVLDEFEKFSPEIQSQFNIYVLTSSIDELDKQRAHEHKLVYGFFVKPLSDKQLESVFLVKKYKNSFLRPVAATAKKQTYTLPDDDRKILDKILPYFELRENLHIKKCIRMAFEKDPRTLNNMPVSLHAERISSFLMLQGFANNFSGDPVISHKGMQLKEAGSLKNFEKMSAS